MNNKLYHYSKHDIDSTYSRNKQSVLFIKYFLFDKIGIDEFLIISKDDIFNTRYENRKPIAIIKYSGKKITNDEEMILNLYCSNNGFLINSFHQITDTDMLMIRLEHDL